MAAIDRKKEITAALGRFQNDSLFENSIHLFNTLRYDTSQRLRLSAGTFDEFNHCYLSGIENFDERKACATDWRRVEMLFVLTDKVIQKQVEQFKSEKIADKDIRSYLFFALELKQQNYTRTQLSQITREFNKAFPEKPIFLLLKYGEFLTLAIIDRRLNKLNQEKDVLQQVTLIKDILINSPHRAHLEILFDLDFYQLYQVASFKNFVDLHTAWRKKLDTSELNKKFYRELSNWYFWACQHVVFPADMEPNTEKRNAVNLIRLITRLMFVWFLKEKGLVPPEFFNKSKLDNMLLYDDKKGSTYYKAILQNLFFATLNQEMNPPEAPKNRKFRNNGQHHNITNLYRYRRYFKNPNEALDLFSRIPFLNGGLFECLDRCDKNDPRKIIRLDGFSDAEGNPLKIPDFLFFQEDEIVVDLSAVYDDTNRRNENVRGIIHILSSYKFTIIENTSVIEEEIALDPELLGKVFENLLASYNPETRTTARKQTGSFYTPREIVNYMVDVGLAAYLETKLLEYYKEASMSNRENERWGINDKLRHLLSYSVTRHDFTHEEANVLIQAIDDAKILDPACGSGAFPMGMLHKMVHVLNKLDPQNESWKRRQIARVRQAMAEAKRIEDIRIREKSLFDLRQNIASIESAFKDNELDFSRKLYLIERCIHGVDIQPIAVQITKLRFFISLIVDQKTAQEKENLGIRPLPNLETKFIAANTLIPIEKQAQTTKGSLQIELKEEELRQIRETHFAAIKNEDKSGLRERDRRLRAEIAELLFQAGSSREQVDKLTQWDPYDQNASAGFFDSEWMFGVRDGFDVVIGNPPYVDSEKMVFADSEYREQLKLIYQTAKGNWDLFVVFTEKAMKLMNLHGVFVFIVPNKLIGAKYSEALRWYLSKKTFKEIRDYSSVGVFLEQDVYPITIFLLNEPTRADSGARVDMTMMNSVTEPRYVNSIRLSDFVHDIYWDRYFFDKPVVDLLMKIWHNSKLYQHVDDVVAAATVSEAYLIKKHLFESKGGDGYKFINTGTIDPYLPLWGVCRTRYIKSSYQHPRIAAHALKRISTRRAKQANSTKIIIAGMSNRLEAILDEGEYLAGKSTSIILGNSQVLKSLLGIVNSRVLSFFLNHFFHSLKMAGGYINVGPEIIKNLPICPGFACDCIISTVDKIITTTKRNHGADTTEIKRQLDLVVFKLYNLNWDEVRIVDPGFSMSSEEYATIASAR